MKKFFLTNSTQLKHFKLLQYAFESSIVVIYGFNRCQVGPISTNSTSTSPFYDLYDTMKSLNISSEDIKNKIEFYLVSERNANDTFLDDLSYKIKRAENAAIEMFGSTSNSNTLDTTFNVDNSTSNSFILQHFNVNDDTLIPCVIALTIFFLVFRISSYFVLLYKSAPKK